MGEPVGVRLGLMSGLPEGGFVRVGVPEMLEAELTSTFTTREEHVNCTRNGAQNGREKNGLNVTVPKKKKRKNVKKKYKTISLTSIYMPAAQSLFMVPSVRRAAVVRTSDMLSACGHWKEPVPPVAAAHPGYHRDEFGSLVQSGVPIWYSTPMPGLAKGEHTNIKVS